MPGMRAYGICYAMAVAGVAGRHVLFKLPVCFLCYPATVPSHSWPQEACFVPHPLPPTRKMQIRMNAVTPCLKIPRSKSSDKCVCTCCYGGSELVAVDGVYG